LKYYVYQSISDNIATVTDGTEDIGTYSVTGLTAETNYYFNIIVEDEAGNKSAYTTKTETTVAP